MGLTSARPRVLHLALLVVVLLTGVISRATAQTELWRYTAPQEIAFLELSPFGTVLVGMDTLVVALDPESGNAVWRYRRHSRFVPRITPVGYTGLAILGEAVLDLGTGQERWRMDSLALKPWRRWIGGDDVGLMVVLGETDDNGFVVVGADLATGRVAWRHDSLLTDLSAGRRMAMRLGSTGRELLVDTDTTLVLFLDNRPPYCVHARTGQMLWRADSTWPSNAPARASGAADVLAGGGRVFVPFGRRLLGLDAATGQILWRRGENLPSAVAQMELTGRGLLVRGSAMAGGSDAFLDLLDPATGASLWSHAVLGLGHVSPFLVRGDSILIPAGETLLKIALADGGIRRALAAAFEGEEQPTAIEPRPEGLLLSSNQNLALMSDSGLLRYQRFYPLPAATSFLSQVARGALQGFVESGSEALARITHDPSYRIPTWRFYNQAVRDRYRATINATEYACMLTTAPDTSGRKGFSLVRVRKADGQEAGRIWVTQRRPQYVLDPVTQTVFLREGDRDVTARRFF